MKIIFKTFAMIRLRASLLAALAVVQPSFAGSPEVRTDKNVYEPKERIVVIFKNATGNSADWVTVVPKETPDKISASIRRQFKIKKVFLQRRKEGSNTLSGRKAGRYEARFYPRDGQKVLARYPFTVGEATAAPELKKQSAVRKTPARPKPASDASGPDSQRAAPNIDQILAKDPQASVIMTEKPEIKTTEEVVVHFANMPGNAKDWIAIASADQPAESYWLWTFLYGATEGTYIFQRLLPGSYEVRLYENGGNKIAASYPFVVVDSTGRQKKPSRKELQSRVSPEPPDRGPLTGVWQGRIECGWAESPVTLKLAIVHFGDMSLRGITTLSASGKDGTPIVARYHTYGMATGNWAGKGTKQEIAAGTAQWELKYALKLAPGPWIKQPDFLSYAEKIRISQRRYGDYDLEGTAPFSGCNKYLTLKQTDKDEPDLEEPPEKAVLALDRLRYPARFSDKNWYVSAANLFPEFGKTRFGTAADNVVRCGVLDDWVETVYAQFPDTARPLRKVDDAARDRARKLFTDPTFVPVFGHSIDDLSESARRFIVKLSLDYCGAVRSRAGQEFTQLIGQYLYNSADEIERATEYARAHRKASAWMPDAMAEFRALPTEATAYEPFLEITDNAISLLAPLWPRERASYYVVQEETHRRLAGVTLAARLKTILQESAGISGARELANFSSEYKSLLERVTADVAAETFDQIDARLTGILKFETAADFAMLRDRGEGLDALRAGDVWYEAYIDRFDGFLDYDEVVDQRAAFEALRRSDIAAARTELLDIVEAIGTIREIVAFKASNLTVPGDWKSATGSELIEAMRNRKASIYTSLESSDAGFWLLTGFSPYEEQLMSPGGTLKIPSSYPEPHAHEILLAVVRSVAKYSGERLNGNMVRYKLPSLRRVLASFPGIGTTKEFMSMTDIDVPIYANITFKRSVKNKCRKAEAGGYFCKYTLSTYVESDSLASGGASNVEDHFTLGAGGWYNSTISQRLATGGLQTWGMLSDTVVQGLHAIACSRAGLADTQCQ